MTNRTGADFEIALEKYLTARGVDARRLRQHGKYDHGDLQVVDADGDAWTIEAKKRNHDPRPGEIDAWAEEARTEADHAGTPFWCVVVKRHGKTDPGLAWLYLPVRTLLDCLDRAPTGAPRGDLLVSMTVNDWLPLIGAQEPADRLRKDAA